MYYAVRKGKVPGIYSTWDEAKAQVQGFSGAVYKKFANVNDANMFLSGGGSSDDEKPKKLVYYAVKNDNTIFTDWSACQEHIKGMSGAIFKKFKTEHEANVWLATELFEQEEFLNVKIPTFYVDGSYRDDIISFGMVALVDGSTIEYSGRTDGGMNNCSGEISAFAFALHFAHSMNLHEINVVYDNLQIMQWAKGIAKTHNEESRKFKYFVDTFLLRNQIKVNYYKCKSHSGDFYNERADWLAKRALIHGEMYKQDNLFNEGLVLNA